MALSTSQVSEIRDLLNQKICNKLEGYTHEPYQLPFHTRLLGNDRMAFYSFVQSFNSMLRTSIFAEVGQIIAKPHFKHAQALYKDLNPTVSTHARTEVLTMVYELTIASRRPSKVEEIERIRRVANSGTIMKVKRPQIDLFLISQDNVEYYFDIKATKPHLHSFLPYKLKILEWAAYRLQINPDAKLHTCLAVPYNPFEPEGYQVWIAKGACDIPEELFVEAEFWDMLGGQGTYEELLDVFEAAGSDLRPIIDAHFERLGN